MSDIVNRLQDYEAGQLDRDETLALFVDLLNTGVVNELQGSYGRTAKTLLESGTIVFTTAGIWGRRDGDSDE